MKTIAELKAEQDKIRKRLRTKSFPVGERENLQEDSLMLSVEIKTLESFSRQIAEDVGKCENIIEIRSKWDAHTGELTDDNVLCKSVPPEQKCEGCKRALEIKRWLE